MLRIDRVVIHNFKSFRHASIGFSGGFNCIAGPNGSGKSNVCDSLLFALGEQSLRRMRVSTAAQLVNDSGSNSDRHTYVKVAFDGDRQMEVSREIRNGNIVYRLDGKAITRQEMVDTLRDSHCDINETNTITQGETARLLSLNPRERRELIDIAAGIREFDIKKEEAKKELERVESKMGNAQVLLNERAGFLQELEKEKEQAELYTKTQESLRNMNYTLLKLKEEQLGKEYERRFEAFKSNQDSKQKCEKGVTEIDAEVLSLSSQKEQFAKRLNESSLDASANTRSMEQLGKEIALGESKLEAIASGKSGLSERERKLHSEREKLSLKHDENRKLISITEADLSRMDVGDPVTDEEAGKLASSYKDSQDKLAELSARRDSLEKDHSQIAFDVSNTDKEAERLRSELSGNAGSLTKLEAAHAAVRERLSKIRGEASSLSSEVSRLQKSAAGTRDALSRLEAESINVREQLAMYGNSDRVSLLLSSAIRSGFHGRAGDLCTYEQRYALAVQAAAGSRFNYIIVDSMKVAEQAIKVLKEKGAGRATFIPLNEVMVQQQREKGGARTALSCIKFDAKFRKAFEYIFSNTYVVASIDEAKAQGIGTARYATMSGEIVEASGIVSGGSSKAQPNAMSLNAKLNEVNAMMAEARKSLQASDDAVAEARKRLSASEAEMVKAEIEERYASEELGRAKSTSSSLASRLKEAEASSLKLANVMEKLTAELDAAVSELNAERARNSRLSGDLTKLLVGGSTSQDDAARARTARKEAEQCRVRLAELNKENSMINARLAEMESELFDIGVNSDKLSADEKRVHAEVLAKSNALAALKEKTKTYDKDTQGLYSMMKGLDDRIASKAMEKGRLQGALERLNRDILENETAKAQIEVRLGDIRAELPSYQNASMVAMKADSLEQEIAISRRKLEELGMVNLKAPELYGRKKRDVEEAQAQISVLENEKSSILAMMDEIESKKLNVFMQTFSLVGKNFRELYGHVFEGDAELSLEKPGDPFNSGLVIGMTEGKHRRHLDRLSGGEKTLVMMMLLFAIQMMHPMGFYIFDEIDASLDKENSKKLSTLIRELSSKSQFIVVTHNDSMITSAATGIGIAMQGRESRAIGIAINR